MFPESKALAVPATGAPVVRSLGLKRNPNRIEAKDFLSLAAMFAPGVGFAAGLVALWRIDERFAWVWPPENYPVHLYIIAICGTIATIGGLADWVYHRLYVAAGPNERRTHLLALGTGGFPLFVLMAFASITGTPGRFLVPILIVALHTTALVCYDEFAFHRKRCLPLETAMHWSTVFGNAVAWLAWMHWCFAV